MNENIAKIAEMIMRLNTETEARFGVRNGLSELKVAPELFDRLIIDAYRDGIRTIFTPSSAHDFNICGVKISPKYKRAEE